jgi:hypothetical protein
MTRNRSKTIESLRRLAERPGTVHEGEIARHLLEQMGALSWTGLPFDGGMFPTGTVVFYCYRCYRNERGVICKQTPSSRHGQWWMRIKFDYLKQPRWVPVTSPLGCHLSREPFTGDKADTLYNMNIDWKENQRELFRKFRTILTRENIERMRGEWCDEVIDEAISLLQPKEALA